MKKHLFYIILISSLNTIGSASKAESTKVIERVCTEVTIKSLYEKIDKVNFDKLKNNKKKNFKLKKIAPDALMKRLIKYSINNRYGYMASTEKNDCKTTIKIEMYPHQYKRGWTIFSKYTGTHREIKVDRVLFEEIPIFAERAVESLLNNKIFSETMSPDKVLLVDSPKKGKLVKPLGFIQMRFGNQFIGTRLPTASEDSKANPKLDYRLSSPFIFGLGYRGKLNDWAVDINGVIGIHGGRKGVKNNILGGHVDFSGLFGGGISVLKYIKPDSLNSFYLGVGSSFQANFFSVLQKQPETNYFNSNYDSYISGGMQFDMIAGMEFIRSSNINLFLESKLALPIYYTSIENDYRPIQTWTPNFSFSIGTLF